MSFWVIEKREFGVYRWSVWQVTVAGNDVPVFKEGKVVAGPFACQTDAETDRDGRTAVQDVMEVSEEPGGRDSLGGFGSEFLGPGF